MLALTAATFSSCLGGALGVIFEIPATVLATFTTRLSRFLRIVGKVSGILILLLLCHKNSPSGEVRYCTIEV